MSLSLEFSCKEKIEHKQALLCIALCKEVMNIPSPYTMCTQKAPCMGIGWERAPKNMNRWKWPKRGSACAKSLKAKEASGRQNTVAVAFSRATSIAWDIMDSGMDARTYTEIQPTEEGAVLEYCGFYASNLRCPSLTVPSPNLNILLLTASNRNSKQIPNSV